MRQIKIDKAIPIPSVNKRRNTYPYGDMEVGDSFAFYEEEKKHISASAYNYGSYHNKKFRVRGLRVWRVG